MIPESVKKILSTDKDNKIATDNIKLHSELKGEPLELFNQFFNFAVEKIKENTLEMKLPSSEKIKEVTIRNFKSRTVEINPVTQVIPSKKVYKRKPKHKPKEDDDDVL